MHRIIVIPLSILALAYSVVAQASHRPDWFPIMGDAPNDVLGESLSAVGDVDGDGVTDYIVGARLANSAIVISGANGTILYRFFGDDSGDQFGGSVSGAGDVNGDGVPDFIVGARFDDNNGSNSGSARVFSGANGSVLYTLNGDVSNDQFGDRVSGLGDVNGDGFDDFMVAAKASDLGAPNGGLVRVFSGANGSVLLNITGPQGSQFGWSISSAGDVNNDGRPEILIGTPFGTNPDGASTGRAIVVSATNGAPIFNFYGDSSGDSFGQTVAAAGDINGDGFDDFMVGAPSDDNNGSSSGTVRVFSGFDGSTLYSFDGDNAGDTLGSSVAGGGDVNGDGVPDIIAGASFSNTNGTQRGYARVYSGADGSIVYTFLGEAAGDRFGTSVASIGDINADGLGDLIIGAPLNDTNGSDSGAVRVFRSIALPGSPTSCPGDATGDGQVDLADLNAILSRFGTSCPPETVVVQAPYTTHFITRGNSAFSDFGNSVSACGDVNGDGFDDFIVGARSDDTNGTGSGSARVYSGRDGTVLYTVNGESELDFCGESVSGAGDVNADGFDDFVVGVPFEDALGFQSGSVFVYSGLDGSLLQRRNGREGDNLGTSVGGVGDINGDGFADFIVGMPGEDDNGTRSGAATVVLGNTNSGYGYRGDSANDIFGESVSGAGDVNGDGVPDFIIGAPGSFGSGAGYARVYSGDSPFTVLYTLNGDLIGSEFGASVSGAGDVNGDGFDDVIVGAPRDNDNGSNSGSAKVYSGANGAVLYSFAGSSANALFGSSVSSAGDINNDGFADFIIGSPGDNSNGLNSGRATVYSGANGSVLFTYSGDRAGDRFGFSVSDAGDLNGDGRPDLIIGVSSDRFNNVSTGSVMILLSGGTATISVPCQVDLNGDGAVNLADLNAVLSAFGQACP